MGECVCSCNDTGMSSFSHSSKSVARMARKNWKWNRSMHENLSRSSTFIGAYVYQHNLVFTQFLRREYNSKKDAIHLVDLQRFTNHFSSKAHIFVSSSFSILLKDLCVGFFFLLLFIAAAAASSIGFVYEPISNGFYSMILIILQSFTLSLLHIRERT